MEYQAATRLKNVWAFDFFDVLANPNTNLLRSAYYRGGGDSHPNKAGSDAATLLFLTFFKQVSDMWQLTIGIPAACTPMLSFYGNSTIGSYCFLGTPRTGGFWYFLDTTMYPGPFQGNCQLAMQSKALLCYSPTNVLRLDIPNDPVLLYGKVFAQIINGTWVGQWTFLTVWPPFHTP